VSKLFEQENVSYFLTIGFDHGKKEAIDVLG